ncbi:MAG TPA: class I SAM-dependent methyltransferase [Candidatus Woesebacteria bacterium]|nr:class I SAM-dependent methyltransferase [Candidatus Woesebacteria bacterium]
MKSTLYNEWFKKERNEPLSVSNVAGPDCFLKLIPPKNKKVLVIGCGDGHEVAWLNQHKFTAVGITASEEEAKIGKDKYGAKIYVRDMHDLGDIGKFDVIYASNVLEHSTMPFLALMHWRKYLVKNGWLVLVMPSKEWLTEHYHYSVLTRSQMKDILFKTGFSLLAGPKMKSKINFNGGDIFYDLGRKWGFMDGYVSQMVTLPDNHFQLGEKNIEASSGNPLKKAFKTVLKYPYNRIRIYLARNFREW